MISVIIPAHNEEAVITRCLDALLEHAPPGSLEVLVVCNGCTDRTADLARGRGEQVQVLEISVASKVAALNAGDAAATAFPRCYVDADIVVTWSAVRAVSDVLSNGKVLAAAPRIRIELEHCSWCVRSYYLVWQAIPYFKEGTIGAGFYALSEEGRSRFDLFPEITADDGFIRSLFGPDEREVVESAEFVMFPPRTLSGVSAIKTRSRFGTLEQRALLPGQGDKSDASWRDTIKCICTTPRMWPSVPVYLAMVCVTRIRAKWRIMSGTSHSWDRDNSSRMRAS